MLHRSKIGDLTKSSRFKDSVQRINCMHTRLIIINILIERICKQGLQYFIVGFYMIAVDKSKVGEAVLSSPYLETDAKTCLSFWFNLFVSIHIYHL